VSAWSELLRRLGRRSWFPAIARRVAPPVDRVLYRLTGGWLTVVGHDVFPTLLLTTIGRRTGRRRTTPLLYVAEGEAIAVLATNFGQSNHPAWAYNLHAEPEADIQIGRHRARYRAHLADPAEFDRLWPQFVELWPAYEDYRRRSGRDVMLFVLEPI
jgi:deazaflavin-dependent oxidoreductase (nitroreductase family)